VKLLSQDDDVLRRRLSGRRAFVFLDFDGTLAPIVAAPHLARANRQVMRAIESLVALPRARVAVMSGRPLAFVRERFRLRGLYHGGNHGLELRGPGLTFQHRVASVIRPTIRTMAETAKTHFAECRGVIIENKGLTMAVHYRGVPPSFRRRFSTAMATFRLGTASSPVRWRRGKKVWEALPRVKWNKGHALTELLRHVGLAVPVAVGDDVTDEDMFRAVGQKGVSVRIGKSTASRAMYYLPRQADVPRFLGMLTEVLK
jgi:trehalose-phosphatase